MKKYFYVINGVEVRDYGLVNISQDWFINGCPIEDYGDYILSHVAIPVENVIDEWINRNQSIN